MEISLARIHTYPHCCCCAACIRFGALFSRQRSFRFLYCNIYEVCIFNLGVVRWCLTLSFPCAWYQKTRRAPLRARCLLLLLILAAGSIERRRAVCGITFKVSCNGAETKKDFVPIRTRKSPAASKTHPHQKAFFYLWELPVWTCELDPHER